MLNGYPTLKIDRRFLENVFANTEINFLCIDVTPYLVDKAHNDCYYEYAKNQYGRFDIKPNQAFTLKIKRENRWNFLRQRIRRRWISLFSITEI